jgi:hypothetical protein
MKLPAWLVILTHFARGFAIPFGAVVGAAPMTRQTWLVASIAGVIGGANAIDALRSDASNTVMPSQSTDKAQSPEEKP